MKRLPNNASLTDKILLGAPTGDGRDNAFDALQISSNPVTDIHFIRPVEAQLSLIHKLIGQAFVDVTF